MKTYAAETGYVYQYVYRGYRELEHGSSKLYSFAIKGQNSAGRDLSILLKEEARRECEAQIGRKLLDQENYALAKMALFEIFDTESPLPAERTLEAGDMVRFLEKLGRI